MPRTVAIIPSRLESSRLPEKALKDICGLPMIVHVYKRCLLAKQLDDVYVATDSLEIKSVVEENEGKVIFTSRDHQTGTDRIAEACLNIDAEIIVNVQGDEALVDPTHIDKVVNLLQEDPLVNVAILVNSFTKRNSSSDIKVVINKANEVMYFSRTDIPSYSRSESHKMLKAYHIVPFRKDFLLEYSNWEKGKLEQIEMNEYLRILERGHKIKTIEVTSSAISVDVEEDLKYVRNLMPSDKYFQEYAKKGSYS